MVYICCVPTCDSTNEKTHSFPKNENTSQKWINATKRFKLNKKTAWNTHHQVCRKHFKKEDYTSNCFRYLKKGVVPSLNMPVLNAVTEHSYCDPSSVQLATKLCYMTTPEPSGTADDIQTQGVDILDKSDKTNVHNNIDMELTECEEHLQTNLNAFDYGEKINETIMQNDYVPVTRDQVTLTDDDDDDGIAANMFKHSFEKDGQKNDYSPKLNQKSSGTYDPVARKMRYQSTRITYLTKRIREMEKPKESTLNKYLSSKLTVEQNNFVQMMLRNSGKRKQAWRFTKDDKHFALAAYKQSPKAYRHFHSFFGGPGKTTIYKHAAFVRFEAGINPKLLEFVKTAASNLDEDDKYVTVGWDEMSLTTHLDFNSVKDYIDGFVDYGVRREMKFGTHALVFMVRGIAKEFKQPIAYFITENLLSTELSELIRLVIEAILDTGLKVVGSVCDAVQTNRSAVNKLRAKLTRDAAIEYTIRDSKIIHFYDPPHLLKSLRNNLLVKDLKHVVAIEHFEKREERIQYDKEDLTERVASWTDVKDFYDHYRKSTQRLPKTIYDEHIKPAKLKMKVSIAAQVFSRSYGRAMQICSDKKQLPKDRDFTGTANILHFFNDVFDSLNGGGETQKNSLIGSINKSSYHFEFWEYAVQMIKQMKFTDLNGRKDSSKVLSDYIVTIKGLSELTTAMLKIKDTVAIRRMTQDALENFFGGIRNVIYSPSVREFRGAYASMIVNNLSMKHSIYSNCEADDGSPLLRNFNLLLSSSQLQNGNNVGGITVENGEEEVHESSRKADENLITVENDEEESSHEAEYGNETLDYVGGDIIKKLLKNVKCRDCRVKIEVDEAYPSESFLKSLKALLIHGEKELPTVCMESKLKERFGQGIELESEISCEDEEHKKEIKKKLLNITFEYLVMNLTKNVNRALRGNNDDLEPTNHIEKQAMEFYKKKKNIGKYVPKVDLSKHDASKNPVVEVCALKTPVIKKDETEKKVVKVKCNKKPCDKKKVIKNAVIKKAVIKNRL